MSLQKYQAFHSRAYTNGATGWAPQSLECNPVGHLAKVDQCPIMMDGIIIARRTAYAQGPTDTWFSVPAKCMLKGEVVRGYFTSTETGPVFNVSTPSAARLRAIENQAAQINASTAK